jgi:hypothetical protein
MPANKHVLNAITVNENTIQIITWKLTLGFALIMLTQLNPVAWSLTGKIVKSAIED